MIIKDLPTLQQQLLKLLIAFDSFCKQENIHYWLAYGSCLGAVRHNGFIPWDDDIDIEMLEDDYKKLKNVIESTKQFGFVIQNYETDDEYVSKIFKIRDTNSEVQEVTGFDHYYKYKGLYIDIFIRTPVKHLVISKVSQLFQVHLLDKLSNISHPIFRKLIKKINYGIINGILFPILKKINGFGVCGRLGGIPGNWIYDLQDRKDIFPLILKDFEGYNFPIPGNYSAYLTNIYGADYMTPLPPESRHLHFKRVEIFDKDDRLKQ